MNSSRHPHQPAAHPPGLSASTALEVRNVTVRYGSVLALDDASAVIGRGRICGLVGMNGAGKSTLFKSIVGSLKPQSGSVRIEGLPPAKARRAGLIGYVPQAEIVDWDFPITVREVVGMGRYPTKGWFRPFNREDRARVAEAMEQLGITDLAKRHLMELSGGQRQRVYVAQALAQDHEALLLDEPLTGLDIVSARMIDDIIHSEQAVGHSVILTTHDLDEARAADHVILMSGRVVAAGDPEEVLTRRNLADAYGLGALHDTDHDLFLDDPSGQSRH